MRVLTLAVLLCATAACSTNSIRAAVEYNDETMIPALAALETSLRDVCFVHVMENRSLVELMATQPGSQKVDPRKAGSPTATAAWKLDSIAPANVFQLENGCSISVAFGDPERLNARALELLATKGDFTAGQSSPSEDGDAVRTAYCTSGAYPYVAALYKRTDGPRVAFLANVFKATTARPTFCTRGG